MMNWMEYVWIGGSVYELEEFVWIRWSVFGLDGVC